VNKKKINNIAKIESPMKQNLGGILLILHS